MSCVFTDESSLCDYPTISEGSKLHLIVNPIANAKRTSGHSENIDQDLSILRGAAYKFLREFYSESETQKIVEEFVKVSFKCGFTFLQNSNLKKPLELRRWKYQNLFAFFLLYLFYSYPIAYLGML